MGTFVQARHWFTMARTQRNPSQRGINKASRSKSYHNSGKWAIKKKNKGSFPTQAKKAAAPSAPAAQGFYPGDDTLYKRAGGSPPVPPSSRAPSCPAPSSSSLQGSSVA